MDNRRVLLAVLLSVAVIVAWQYFFLPPSDTPRGGAAPAVQAPAETVDETATGASATRPAPETRDGAASASPVQALESEDVTAPEEPPEPEQAISATAERRVVVESDYYRAELSNRGAEIVSFSLKEHTSRDGGPVNLVRLRENAPYPFAIVTPDGAPTPLAEALFTVERREEGGEVVVTFRYAGPAGVADKTFRFHDTGLFDAEVHVTRPRQWALFAGPGVRNPSTEEQASRFERPGAVYEAGPDLERLGSRKASEKVLIPGAGLRWIGLEDTYFLTAFIPETPLAAAELRPVLMQPTAAGSWDLVPMPAVDELSDEQKEMHRELVLLLVPGGPELDLTSYWGAKKYTRLEALPGDLERTVNLGWFGIVARPFLRALLWIHDHVVHNYGWAIVLMTFLIKLVMLPLTQKSYVSMRKMQELNPQMQAIRSKWRGKLRDKQGRMNLDAQRQMNEEIQQLYRTAGVNPAGGCLPMIAQMPVFFAFYQLLSAAVELRGAPWILWVTDLTQPFWPLAIVMGGTQFLQQRMTPSAGDPMQRRMMQAMPVVMTIFFLGFPSGLVLYWLTNNVLTILQQGIYNHWKKQQNDTAAGSDEQDAKTARTRKGGKGSQRVASK